MEVFMLFQFSLFGIPVSVHWSIFLLILLFSLDGFFYARNKQKGRGIVSYLITAFVCSVLIFGSIFIHEAAHALVANSLGFHITEAGVNGLFAYVGNDYDIHTITPLSEFLIAFAGPASNFILALVGVPIIYLLGDSLTETSVRYFSIMNIRLGRYNLWPILFLDGARVLDAGIRATVGSFEWAKYIPIAVYVIFFVYLVTKKKGRFELEKLIDKVP